MATNNDDRHGCLLVISVLTLGIGLWIALDGLDGHEKRLDAIETRQALTPK